MQKKLWGVFSAILLCLAFDASAQWGGKVEMTAQKKRGQEVKGKVGEEGSQTRSTQKESYLITLQNRTQQDLANLTVEYVIFVERQKIGQKKGSETVERVKGSKPVASLSRQPQEVPTDEVTLSTANLVGSYHYASGGRIKAEDSLLGIWVRVMQDGQKIGEYALPSTMTSRGWDK